MTQIDASRTPPPCRSPTRPSSNIAMSGAEPPDRRGYQRRPKHPLPVAIRQRDPRDRGYGEFVGRQTRKHGLRQYLRHGGERGHWRTPGLRSWSHRGRRAGADRFRRAVRIDRSARRGAQPGGLRARRHISRPSSRAHRWRGTGARRSRSDEARQLVNVISRIGPTEYTKRGFRCAWQATCSSSATPFQTCAAD
jgi:hypothetical protein